MYPNISNQNQSPGTISKFPDGAIAGIVVGFVALFTILAILGFLYYKQWRKNQRGAEAEHIALSHLGKPIRRSTKGNTAALNQDIGAPPDY